jgi:hypothetical protein
VTNVQVERQVFTFPAGWDVVKFDDSAHHKSRYEWRFELLVTKQPEVWSRPIGQAAVDLLAWESSASRFLFIEVKDYRQNAPVLPPKLAAVVARKVRDTLAALAQAARDPASDMRAYGQHLASESITVEVFLDLQWPRPRPGKKLAPAPAVVDAALQDELDKAFHRSGLNAKVIHDSNRTEWTVR